MSDSETNDSGQAPSPERPADGTAPDPVSASDAATATDPDETLPQATPPSDPGARDARSAGSPAVEPPTPEIRWGGVADATARLPGAGRGYTKFPTGPVETPALPGLHPDFEWTPDPAPPPQHGFLSPWALAFSALALVASVFVGWGFPLALGGIVTAIIALRRPLENRPAAIWAIVLGGVSLLYSSGWLIWAATRANLISVPIIQ